MGLFSKISKEKMKELGKKAGKVGLAVASKAVEKGEELGEYKKRYSLLTDEALFYAYDIGTSTEKMVAFALLKERDYSEEAIKSYICIELPEVKLQLENIRREIEYNK